MDTAVSKVLMDSKWFDGQPTEGDIMGVYWLEVNRNVLRRKKKLSNQIWYFLPK